MKEDLIEKMIRGFFVVLQKLSGYVTNDDFEGAKLLINEYYSGELIDDFLSDKVDIKNRKTRQELLFQLDLLYNKLIIQAKNNELHPPFQEQYVQTCNKLLSGADGLYDYALQLKLDQIISLQK
ncbi:MAG TPA: hypothetical protein PK191_04125 [Niabella sp.]|nr:hypothetical protein [Niabella sp.]HOZ97322.1 hypothetical protein [Niabella sp.]HQW15407.1 hypothetical protein [Niabella sp.]HQX20547.1 hypothetical protein [Niabella sp.]HQX41080.1 hypothetical protein [Niabella sp.]